MPPHRSSIAGPWGRWRPQFSEKLPDICSFWWKYIYLMYFLDENILFSSVMLSFGKCVLYGNHNVSFFCLFSQEPLIHSVSLYINLWFLFRPLYEQSHTISSFCSRFFAHIFLKNVQTNKNLWISPSSTVYYVYIVIRAALLECWEPSRFPLYALASSQMYALAMPL